MNHPGVIVEEYLDSGMPRFGFRTVFGETEGIDIDHILKLRPIADEFGVVFAQLGKDQISSLTNVLGEILARPVPFPSLKPTSTVPHSDNNRMQGHSLFVCTRQPAGVIRTGFCGLEHGTSTLQAHFDDKPNFPRLATQNIYNPAPKPSESVVQYLANLRIFLGQTSLDNGLTRNLVSIHEQLSKEGAIIHTWNVGDIGVCSNRILHFALYDPSARGGVFFFDIEDFWENFG